MNLLKYCSPIKSSSAEGSEIVYNSAADYKNGTMIQEIIVWSSCVKAQAIVCVVFVFSGKTNKKKSLYPELNPLWTKSGHSSASESQRHWRPLIKTP